MPPTDEETTAWLQSLKEGDELSVYDYGRFTCMTTVTRVTPKFVCAYGDQFRKDTGRIRNRQGPWHMRSIRRVSDQDRTEAYRHACEHHAWKDESLDRLTRILAILREPQTQPTEKIEAQ